MPALPGWLAPRLGVRVPPPDGGGVPKADTAAKGECCCVPLSLPLLLLLPLRLFTAADTAADTAASGAGTWIGIPPLLLPVVLPTPGAPVTRAS
jgi:hypothetical protein